MKKATWVLAGFCLLVGLLLFRLFGLRGISGFLTIGIPIVVFYLIFAWRLYGKRSK